MLPNIDDLTWTPAQKEVIDLLVKNQEMSLKIITGLSELTNILTTKLSDTVQEMRTFKIPSLS